MVRSWRFALSFICVVLLALAVVPAGAEEAILNEVPAYYWTHGCSPTAGTMVMAYWDAFSYSALIPGSNRWSSNQIAIKNAIASAGHISDYALYEGIDDYGWDDPHPDMSEINPGGAHADNCLADFTGTSRSTTGLSHGSTWMDKIGPGVVAYASWRGYGFIAGGSYYSMPTWADFTKEINLGRPVMFGVDSNGDKRVDHSVTVIGYRDTYGYQEYACRDTWSTSTTPRWERFRKVSPAYSWGVYGWDTFRPGGTTRDTMWTFASGNWQDSGWSTGLPDSSAYACITDNAGITISANASAGYVMNRGAISIQSGTFSVGTLASAGSITQSGGSVIASSAVAVGVNGIYTLSGGALTAAVIDHTVGGAFNFMGGVISVGTFQGNLVNNGGTISPGSSPGLMAVTGDLAMSSGNILIELAGTARGTEYDAIDVTGALTLAGTLNVVLDGFMPAYYDSFEIVTAGTVSGVFNLITGGGLIAPNKYLVTVYGADNVTLVAAIPGDADIDRSVDVGDLGILAGNYGAVGGQTWATGDFNGDGNVGVGDLGILAGNYGATVPLGPVPEPACMMILLVGAIGLVRRRRNCPA